ncbi:hypothetical protein DQ04_00111210 [Trypanosoma grayi]|uniref:hypothetical protein n=1 Tax=Trypanosoma grayi TaxID=71804 RepID=UPI0004F43F59|nr:hypothetical protein DQ04_00111210 [Trypanosoma grayi]KEG15321.1 hypothetical protein DQ04_00111210 [Trypanosoma grayi]
MADAAAAGAPPPDAYFRSLLVASLIDRALAEVRYQKPRAPMKVMAVLQQSLTSHAEDYYVEVVNNFENYVSCLSEHGFQAAGKQTVYFACPQRDGLVLELFPNGASVEITEESCTCFLKLLSNLRRNVPTQLRELPVRPTLHINGNYYPLTCLIIDYLTNEDSDWCIDNEEDWDALQVTYCVPFNGQLHDVCPGTRNVPVPFSNARRFGIDAKRLLLQLMEASSNTAPLDPSSLVERQQRMSLMSRGYMDFLRVLEKANTPFGNPMSKEEFDSLGITYSVPFGNTILPLIPGKENERVEYKDKNRFVTLARAKLLECMALKKPPCGESPGLQSLARGMNPMERGFWSTIEEIRMDPTKWSGISFTIRVMNRDILLKENGANITVTKDNVEEYVSLMYGKKDVIHAAFVESELQNTERVVAPPQAPAHSAVRKSVTLEMYPPQNAPQWNTFALEACDVDSGVFRILQDIGRKERMAPKDYGVPFFSFAIPIHGKGLYKLIPHGDTIPVTMSNSEEFLERLEYERKRLKAMDTSARQYVTRAMSPSMAVTLMASALPGDWVPQRYSSPPIVEESEGSQQRQRGARHRASQETMNAAAKSTLDEIDMYEKNLMALKRDKNRISLEAFEAFALRYALTIGGEEVELLDGGRHRLVAVQEIDYYVNMALAKLYEVRRCILTQNLGDGLSNNLKEQKHQQQGRGIPKVTADPMALFSSQHFEPELFAPAQDMTVFRP